jgi:hypothetical protein
MSLDLLANFPHGVNRYHTYAIEALAPLRQALGFEPRAAVIPDSANISVAGNSTYEHRVSVPVGSRLLALSGSTEQPEGFRVQIIDTASNRGLLSQPAQFGNVTGQGYPDGVKDCRGNTIQIVQRWHMLPRPRAIIEPALLKVQVTNLSASPNALQLVLFLAQPCGPERNRWNDVLDADLDLCRRALRGQVIVTGADGQQTVVDAAATDDPLRRPATNQPFSCSTLGDNIVVPGAQGYRIAIHQLSMWNTAKQTVRLLDGAAGVDLMGALTDFPAGGGDFLPYQDEPHFVLQDGHAFVINIAADTDGDATGAVNGFLKYRMFEHWEG